MSSSVIDLSKARYRIVSEVVAGFDAAVTLFPFSRIHSDPTWHQRVAGQIGTIARKHADTIRVDTPAIDYYYNRSIPGDGSEPGFDAVRDQQVAIKRITTIYRMMREGDFIASIIDLVVGDDNPRVIGIATQLAQLPKRVNEGMSIPADTRTPVLNTGYWLDPSLNERHALGQETSDRLPVGRAAAIAITRQALQCLQEPARAVTTPYVFMRAGSPELDSCSDLYRTGLFVRSGSSGLWEMPGLHAGEEYDLYVAQADIINPEDVASAAAKY